MTLRPAIYALALLMLAGPPRTLRSEPPPAPYPSTAGTKYLSELLATGSQDAPRESFSMRQGNSQWLDGDHTGSPPTQHAPVGQAYARSSSRPSSRAGDARRLTSQTAERASAHGRDAGGHAETLNEAWETALAVDLRLEAKRWDASSARQSYLLARSQRWPIVALEGSHTVRSDEASFKLASGGALLPGNVFPYAQDESFAFRTKIDLPLYTSGRIQHGIEAAAAEMTASARDVDNSWIELKMRVAEEYVAVLWAQRDVEVCESSVRSLEAHARDVKMLFDHGRVPRNDLLAAQVALSNSRQRAIQAGNRLDCAQAAYNRRLGRPLTAKVNIAQLEVQTAEADVDTLTDRALRNRPEMAGLGARIRALRHRAAGLRASSRPQVDMQGEYAFEENRYQSPEGIAGLGVRVHWNVFDSGRSCYQAAALLHQAESLRRQQDDFKSTIGLEVRRAWLDVDETARRLDVTRQALQQAEENLRVAKRRYALGAGVNTEVLDAEALRTQTYGNHYDAVYDAVLAMIRLRRATGDLKQPS